MPNPARVVGLVPAVARPYASIVKDLYVPGVIAVAAKSMSSAFTTILDAEAVFTFSVLPLFDIPVPAVICPAPLN